MLTEFGKLCRKIRIDSNQLLADMAQNLGVSAAFLSAVENGKKNVPEGWTDIIVDRYTLDNTGKRSLEMAALESAKQIKIQTFNLGREDKDLVLAFARNFNTLAPADREKMLKLLKK